MKVIILAGGLPSTLIEEDEKMPKPMAEAAIANREIVEIALEEEIPQRNICMVYDSHHPISAAARELKKVISDSHKV